MSKAQSTNKNPIKRPRYHFLEGITDWLTAYAISGALAGFIGGGLWVLLGGAIVLITVMAFMMYHPRAKFKLYLFGLVMSITGIISLNIKTGGAPITAAWILLLTIFITQAILVVRYYQNQIKQHN